MRCGAPRSPNILLCCACQPPVRHRPRAAAALIPEQWEALIVAYGHCCAYCGEWVPQLHREHLVPLSLGGANEVSNIVPACGPCNQRKGIGPPLQPLALRMVL